MIQLITLPDGPAARLDATSWCGGGRIILCSLCGQELGRFWSPVPNQDSLDPHLQDLWIPVGIAITDRYLDEAWGYTLKLWPAPLLRRFFLHSIDHLLAFGYITPRSQA